MESSRAQSRPSRKTEQLIFAGAYPTAYGAAKLAAEQKPVPDCENCSPAEPRYYLFDEARSTS